MTYDIYSKNGELLHAGVELLIAAEIANLDEYDITWAIEEYGRCDSEDYVVVEHGDVCPITIAEGTIARQLRCEREFTSFVVRVSAATVEAPPAPHLTRQQAGQ